MAPIDNIYISLIVLCLSAVNDALPDVTPKCDFEGSMCYYTRKPDFLYSWSASLSVNESYWPTSGCSGTGSGYVAVDASFPGSMVAKLISQPLTQRDQCLQFCYLINGPEANKLSLSMLYTSNNMDTSLWSTSGATADSWQLARVVLPSGTDQYQITLQGSRTNELTKGNIIAIDDISPCTETTTESTTVAEQESTTISITSFKDATTSYTTTNYAPSNRTTINYETTDYTTTNNETTDNTTSNHTTTDYTTTNSIPISNTNDTSADCDFESSLCSYERSQTSIYLFTWQRLAANETTIPASDGYYFLNALVGKLGANAFITTPKMAAGSKCLTFYYYISGNVELTVNYDVDKKPSKVLWSRTGGNASDWSMVQLDLDESLSTDYRYYKIKLTATKQFAALKDAALAVDDIQFHKEACLGINGTSSSSTLITKPMSSTSPSHKNITTPTTLQKPTTMNKLHSSASTDRVPPSSTFISNKMSTDKPTKSKVTDMESTTPSETTSAGAAESLADKKLRNQQRLIEIVVPITVLTAVALALVALFLIIRSRKRAHAEYDTLNNDFTTNSEEDNFAPIFVNRTYTSDQDYAMASLEQPAH